MYVYYACWMLLSIVFIKLLESLVGKVAFVATLGSRASAAIVHAALTTKHTLLPTVVVIVTITPTFNATSGAVVLAFAHFSCSLISFLAFWREAVPL